MAAIKPLGVALKSNRLNPCLNYFSLLNCYSNSTNYYLIIETDYSLPKIFCLSDGDLHQKLDHNFLLHD